MTNRVLKRNNRNQSCRVPLDVESSLQALPSCKKPGEIIPSSALIRVRWREKRGDKGGQWGRLVCSKAGSRASEAGFMRVSDVALFCQFTCQHPSGAALPESSILVCSFSFATKEEFCIACALEP